ncbi:bifunctional folylpolyglutamate synthase/dihydrofolate synthase [Rothia sp. P7181]|uniref:bifunctional folylpolyglutamate synthase/dihydrofolate synthase n=1 Tax=Rothia sp. P7181 TaxID=3402663 RepID=UPI003AE9B768
MDSQSLLNTSNAVDTSTEDTYGVEGVYQELLSRAPENAMAPRLNAVQDALDILGAPHQAAPVIHITGTNGKTSTARMIERLLMAHDLRTGRYTSPHLSKVTERISIDGHPVSDETFVRIWQEIRPYLDIVDAQLSAAGEPRITYFEALTILAFAIFADEPVDVVVLEVGIGGVWDATNVAQAQVSVVTPISYDHTDILGQTLAEIAAEKSGIIKEHGMLISAVQDPEAAQVLLERAQAVSAGYRFEGVEFGVLDRRPGVGGQMVDIRGLADTYTDVPVPLFGEHQSQNAAVAIAAVEAFLGGAEKPLNVELIRQGWEELTSPGRLEVLKTAPTIILDAAHNPHGIRASAHAFKESFAVGSLGIVIGVLGEKDAVGIFETIREEYFDSADFQTKLYLTASDSARAIDVDTLKDMALDAGLSEFDLQTYERLDDALSAAVDQSLEHEEHASAILITGSITVIGQVRSSWLPDGEGL